VNRNPIAATALVRVLLLMSALVSRWDNAGADAAAGDAAATAEGDRDTIYVSFETGQKPARCHGPLLHVIFTDSPIGVPATVLTTQQCVL
jgi:hypothetical protein